MTKCYPNCYFLYLVYTMFYVWLVRKKKKQVFTCFFTNSFVGVKLISCKCPSRPRKVLHPVHYNVLSYKR